ncbi:hypothetical protein H8F23_22820 [Pseudomonas sp. P155]|jgi:hypothetical protein|uniref:Uncharacterized protein n=1 Tax=Pseudomonas neuropathica TaxID=2730425 RepID=A0ABS0BRT5_9PSED|nr:MULTISPECIES: hypothetical protein [Pseudomonas]MBF6036093.1 hypothetical protein [Pseudomonas neuropathica]MDT3310959.1 hypothetical protein [Pseudomonas sp. rhizo66]
MTNDDEFWFVLIFGGLFFGLVFISAVGQAYLYFFKRQRILSHLDNSLGVLKRKSFLSGGVFGAFFVFACLGSCLVLPSWAIKGGSLDEDDYLNFPLGLLRAIRFFYLAALGGGVALIVFLIGCKYMGWI